MKIKKETKQASERSEHTLTPDVLDSASCQSCDSKMIAYKINADALRAVNSLESNENEIQRLKKSNEMLLSTLKTVSNETPHHLDCFPKNKSPECGRCLVDGVIAQAEEK